MDELDTTTTTTTPPETTGASSPATTTPASPAPSPVERPKTALQALEQAAAAQESPIAATSASAATAQPAIPDPNAASVTPGPIPFNDHKTILENTRTKAFTERDAQWQAQVGWARAIPAQDGPSVVEFYKAMDADPVAFYQRLGQTLAAHPQFGPRFQQVAGNGHAATPAPSLDPDVEVRDEQGRVVGTTFSSDRVKAIVQDAVTKAVAEVRGEVAPLRDAHRKSLEDRRTQETQATLNAHADKAQTRVDKILGVTKDAQGKPDARSFQLLQKVASLLVADPSLDVYDAALQVREQLVVPQQTEQARVEVTADMRRKAQANTANGAGAGVSPITKPKTEKELAQWMRERAGASA